MWSSTGQNKYDSVDRKLSLGMKAWKYILGHDSAVVLLRCSDIGWCSWITRFHRYWIRNFERPLQSSVGHEIYDRVGDKLSSGRTTTRYFAGYYCAFVVLRFLYVQSCSCRKRELRYITHRWPPEKGFVSTTSYIVVGFHYMCSIAAPSYRYL